MPRGTPNNKTEPMSRASKQPIKWRKLYIELLKKTQTGKLVSESTEYKAKPVKPSRDETVEVLSSIIREAIINKATG